MKKILLITAIALIILLGVSYAKLGSILETGIRTAGPDVLKVAVNVDSVSLSPFSGSATIENLTIGQPTGFGEGPMIALGDFSLKLKAASLLSDHIIIDHMTISAPLFDIRRQKGQTNFKVFQDGLDLQDTPSDQPRNITLTIRKLEVQRPRILAKTDGFLKLDKDIVLADFTLTNLGTDEKGLAPTEIARHIMDTLQPQITKALIAAGASDKVKKLADDAKGKIKKGLGGFLKKLGKKKK
jgi:hypothetical protein